MIFKKYLSLIAIVVFVQCENHENKTSKSFQNEIVYAKGFQIKTFTNFKILTINRAFIGDVKTSEYYIFPKNNSIPDSLTHKKIIRTPINRIVCTSTSHIPMLEVLNEENKLVGFPNTHYISSEKTCELIRKGKITDVGHEQAINPEVLLSLKPDLFVGFAVDQSSKMYENIEKIGIPVLMNGDWMEESPLGRAEWIKFFGLLFEKENQANKIFDSIEKNYLNLKLSAQGTSSNPTVMNGSLFQDVWYTAAGNSFLAQMINDASANYLWKNSQGTGSLALSIENVLDIGKNADFWIAPGDFISMEQMIISNKIYKEFNPLKLGKTYTYAHLKGENGGLYYFEMSPLHPDWVLEDLIQIFHPNLFLKKEFHFFKKLE